MFKENIEAYGRAQKLGLSQRATEAMALVKAERMLEEAKENADESGNYESALKFNQRLWTIIQADLVEEGNPLPASLKANILSLSIFVDRQTLKAFADPKAENLDILISLNKNIASGLLSNTEGSDEINHSSRPAVPPNLRPFSPGDADFRPTQTG